MKHNNLICFTKQDLAADFVGSLNTLNDRIQRGLKSGKILKLKNGLYIEALDYFNEVNKSKLAEFLATRIYSPSYVSLEYALHKHHLLFSDFPVTSITTKTNRLFSNSLGTFKYSNIKQSLYFGFEEILFRGNKYYLATKAKALFDYLYLKSDLQRRNSKKMKYQLFEESGIQWANFSEEDFKEFDKYVWQSNSKKMMNIWRILDDYYAGKKFDSWAKQLLRS